MEALAPPAWRHGTIRAGGLALATFAAGSEAEDARTVLLLHGLGHWSDAAWGRLVAELDPSLRYLALDLPGFGASDKPDAAYDLPFFREVLDGAVAALGLRRFALAGHSLGGFLAADYAGREPDRVERLALIAPAGFSRAPRFLIFALASNIARGMFLRPPSRRLVSHVLARSVVDASSLDPAVVERAHEHAQDIGVRRAFASIYAGGVRIFARGRALRAGFARYRGPVFCAWGRRDRYIAVSTLRDVVRVYPHAATLILENSAHLPTIEEPQVLANALRTFLAP